MHKSNVRYLYNLTVDKNGRRWYYNGEVISMGRPKKEGGISATDYKRDFNVKRGKKDRYKEAAKAAGYSLNEFMEKAMDKLAAEILGE